MPPYDAAMPGNLGGQPVELGKVWQPVQITKCINGFIVTVGCKYFVAMNWEQVYKALGEYWDDPNAARKKYCTDESEAKVTQRV